MGIETGIGLALSGAGLLQNREAQRKQDNAQKQATDYNSRAVALQEDEYRNFKSPAFQRMFDLASSYDPIAEARGSVEHASNVTKDTITRAMRGLNADFRAGGVNPANTSEFNVRATGMTNRAADPLRAFIADATANPSLKKMQAFESIVGGSPAGGLTNAYFNGAGNVAGLGGPGGDFTGVARLLDQLMKKGPDPMMTGAGGSGDRRGFGTATSTRNGLLGNEWGN